MKSFLQLFTGPTGIMLVGALLSAIGAVWAAHQKASFERAMREKTEEISELNKELKNSVIGGESFCYLTMANINDQTNVALLVAVQEGIHPLYDVVARVTDLGRMRELGANVKFEDLVNSQTQVPIGNMISKSASSIGIYQLGGGDSRSFNIFFSARNGWFDEALRLRRINGHWVMAIQVKRKGSVLFEKVDEKFPRNGSGAVEW